MAKLEFNKILLIAVGAVSVIVLGGLTIALILSSRTRHLTLTAGAKTGESYILSSALKNVVERHFPKIQIKLLETGGTVENLQMLSVGQAQMATAQADVLPGPEG